MNKTYRHIWHLTSAVLPFSPPRTYVMQCQCSLLQRGIYVGKRPRRCSPKNSLRRRVLARIASRATCLLRVDCPRVKAFYKNRCLECRKSKGEVMSATLLTRCCLLQWKRIYSASSEPADIHRLGTAVGMMELAIWKHSWNVESVGDHLMRQIGWSGKKCCSRI